MDEKEQREQQYKTALTILRDRQDWDKINLLLALKNADEGLVKSSGIQEKVRELLD